MTIVGARSGMVVREVGSGVLSVKIGPRGFWRIFQRTRLCVRFEQSVINRERRLHAFGRSGDDELHTAAGIPRGVDARDVRRGVFPTQDAVISLAKFATELFRER